MNATRNIIRPYSSGLHPLVPNRNDSLKAHQWAFAEFGIIQRSMRSSCPTCRGHGIYKMVGLVIHLLSCFDKRGGCVLFLLIVFDLFVHLWVKFVSNVGMRLIRCGFVLFVLVWKFPLERITSPCLLCNVYIPIVVLVLIWLTETQHMKCLMRNWPKRMILCSLLLHQSLKRYKSLICIKGTFLMAAVAGELWNRATIHRGTTKRACSARITIRSC